MATRPSATPFWIVCIVAVGSFVFGLLKVQLWGFLVASAVGPDLHWTEEGTDEGKALEYESRQFGGWLSMKLLRRGVEMK